MRTENQPKQQHGLNNSVHINNDLSKLNLHIKQMEMQISRLREMIKNYQVGYRGYS